MEDNPDGTLSKPKMMEMYEDGNGKFSTLTIQLLVESYRVMPKVL